MKRVISLMLSIAMIASLATGLAVTGFAEDATFEYEGLMYKVLDEAEKTVEVMQSGTDYTGEITIPATVTNGTTYNVTSIGGSAFYRCTRLTSVTIPDSVTSIGEKAFYQCEGLTSITIGNSVTSIGSNAFYGCSGLTNVEIPNNVITISDNAFQNCTKLTSVTIPASVESIGKNAFSGCTGLTSVTVKATTPPTLSDNAFNSCNSLAKIYVPAGKKAAYDSGWSAYANKIEEIKAITINGEDIEDCYASYGADVPQVSGDTVTIDKISVGYGFETLDINIPDGKTLKVSATNFNGIDAFCDIKISGGGKLIVNVLGDDLYLKAIVSNDTVTIEDCNIEVTANGNDTCGIVGRNGIIVKTDLEVYEIKSLAVSSYVTAGTIKVNNITINDSNVEDYFHNNANDVSYGEILINGSVSANAVTGTNFIYVSTYSAPDPEDDESDIEESDPEVDITIGNETTTLKSSYKSVVFNDKKYFEFEVMQSNNLFVPVDLSAAPQKIDGLFLNNDVYKYISGVGKGIELETRFAKADVFKKDDIGQNPLSLHLTDVSEEQGKCATAIQKAAMKTSKVYAQVNYSFVTNGKPTENDAKIYVPVPAEAKVFYLFNEGKIGVVPCENIDGYCVFDRYYDGTYVVVAK